MKIDICVFPLFLICTATGLADQSFTGETTLANPGGRELLIGNDDGDSTLTFHDVNNVFYSMGIDYSDGRKFKIGYGGEVGHTDFFSMNAAGRIGFGTNNHTPYFFQICGQANPITFGVEGAYPTISQSGTNYFKQMEIGQPVYSIPAGIIDSGYRISLAVQGYVYTDDFAGTLSKQIAAWIRAGSNASAPTGRIVNSYALYIENLTSANVEIDNAYGVYQVSPSAKNYFSGNVGIGTTNPQNELDVNGTIRAKEVIVETNWADYVFEDAYNLLPLSEVERHIAEHGRLPGVPSAGQVQADGLSVSEAQTSMMAKIEELTLYAIAQDRKLAAQSISSREKDERIASLEARLQRVESLLNN